MYKELNDNEIIYMIKESEDNLEILLEKYKPIIINICKKYLKLGINVGLELDDLIQIANISLINSISYYKDTSNNSFFTYVIRCIENNIRTELRKELTYRKKTLNNALSLDETITGTNITLLDVIKDENVSEPIDYLLLEEKQIKYVKFINSLPLEVAVVFEMKNGGCTNSEISKFLHIDKSTVSRYASYAKNRLCLN
ncbi:MAG: sigma-70 family RNA polymerase sigma factor [Bacilli bacterium]|nr:sigma-70 family RNA polymerase sigma factor [Bacilli bacterium]